MHVTWQVTCMQSDLWTTPGGVPPNGLPHGRDRTWMDAAAGTGWMARFL